MTWLFLLSLYFFVAFNWVLSFTSLDEGRNMSAVYTMLKSGDFLVPYYNCDYRFEKPPMLYWAVGLFSVFFGLGEFSARLVSGLSAVGVSFMTYLFAKKYLDQETAKKSFLLLLTIPHMWLEARAVVPEMLNTFFAMLSLYFFLGERFVLGWLFSGFAFLTKGPVGPFLAVGTYLLWKRSLRVFEPKGLFVFFVVGGSWYYLMLYHFGYEYFYRFFIYENVMRYTGERPTHPSPFYYYILVLLFSTFFYLPAYPSLIKRFDRSLLPFALWFLFVVLFFSLAKNKLHHYILFAYPPLAVMLASGVSWRYLRVVLALSFGLLSLLGVGLYLYEKERFVPKAYPIVASYEGRVSFYKAEDSALVFYSRRCIGRVEEPSKAVGLVITKEKSLKELKHCKVILRGREFDGVYILLDCE